MEEGDNAVDIAQVVTAPSGAVLRLYHGTDLASANSISAIGVNVVAARSLNGGGEFWVSLHRADAELLAYLNPSGGPAALFLFELADTVISQLLSGNNPVAYFHPPRWLEFLPGSFALLNAKMTGKQVIILP